MKDKKILFGIVVAFVFLLSMGLTYAYFTVTTNIEGEPNDILTSTGTMDISYSDGPEILSEDIEPGWTVTKTVSVENTGSLDVFYAITWASLYNDIENDELVMSATCEGTYYDEEYDEEHTYTCEGLDITPVTAGNIIEGIYIEPGDIHEYTFTFTFLEKNSAQNYNQGKRFNGVLNVIESEHMPNLYVQLLNSLNAPIVGATVETHSVVRTAVTDENGYAIISKVQLGEHELVIKDSSNNTLDTRTITVQNGNESTIVGNTLTSYKTGRDKSITIKMNESNEINIIEDLVVAPEGCFEINSEFNYYINDYYNNINNDSSEMMCPREFIIPSSINGTAITSIGKYVFDGNQLTSVIIPSSVETIGNFAFSNNQLTSVIIPESVESIGYSAFSQNKLTSVTIPDSVTSISGGAFNNNLLPEENAYFYSIINRYNVVDIERCANYMINLGYQTEMDDAIAYCNNTGDSDGYTFDEEYYSQETIDDMIEENIIELDNQGSIGIISYGGAKRNNVVIPNTIAGMTVTNIGYYAFYGNQLTSVTIPDSVTSIGDSAFENNQLTSVTIPNPDVHLDDCSGAFASNPLTYITIAGVQTTDGLNVCLQR